MVELYADAAISGSHTNRLQLQRMLADAAKRRFKVLLVDDQSRLSRDPTDTHVLIRQLDDLGIAVIDVQKGIDLTDEGSSINIAVGGIVNSQWISSIRYKTQNALRGRAMDGSTTGGRAYGYTSIESPDPKKQYPDLPIVPQQLWDQVQATLPAKRTKRSGSTTRAPYPLSGLLKCADCGGSFNAVSGVKDPSGQTYRNLGCVR